MTVETKDQSQSTISSEISVANATDPILDLKKEVAQKYVDNLKNKAGL